MLLENAMGSQKRAEQATKTRAINERTDFEANDDPCTTVTDEENQQFCNKHANEPKDHLNKFDDDGTVFITKKSETFLPDNMQEITDTSPPTRGSRPEYEPHVGPRVPRMICPTKREHQRENNRQ